MLHCSFEIPIGFVELSEHRRGAHVHAGAGGPSAHCISVPHHSPPQVSVPERRPAVAPQTDNVVQRCGCRLTGASDGSQLLLLDEVPPGIDGVMVGHARAKWIFQRDLR